MNQHDLLTLEITDTANVGYMLCDNGKLSFVFRTPDRSHAALISMTRDVAEHISAIIRDSMQPYPTQLHL